MRGRHAGLLHQSEAWRKLLSSFGPHIHVGKMSTSLPGGWFESGHGAIAVFVKDFRDPLERKKKLMLRPWASIKDIKDQLQVVFNVPPNAQKLFFQGRELKNQHNLQECGIYHDNAVLDFVARRQQALSAIGVDPKAAAGRKPSQENLLPHQMPMLSMHPYGAQLLPMTLMKVMHQALQGLALGLAPVLAMDGTGGTYFFKDPSHRNVGCFKPQDEEPFGPNNPRGLVGELGQSGLRRGILSGEACERELAAYLLDKDHFASVPATSLVEAHHPSLKYPDSRPMYFKMGSLQEFVRHDDVASDLAPNQFTSHQVHKIVLLDMRLLNTDRNDANILVRKRRSTSGQIEYELIPIDHGYCLPQFLEIAWCDWCWFNWPQLKKPLSEADRKYVLSLCASEDAEWLAKRIPMRRACRRNMIIAGMVVQKGVKAHLVLYDIARIMCREDLDAPSTLELLCLDAFHQVQRQRVAEANAATNPVLTSIVIPPPSRTGGPSSPRSGSPKSLHVSIEIPPADDIFTCGDCSPERSGARSPPGFWASQAPFSWADEDEEEDEEDEEYMRRSRAQSRTMGNGSMHWDDMASNALLHAVRDVESAAKPTANVADHSAPSSSSPPTSPFAGEHDKDEFEVLNESLDENPSDEKLFLTVLGRLLDEKVDAIRSRQQPDA